MTQVQIKKACNLDAAHTPAELRTFLQTIGQDTSPGSRAPLPLRSGNRMSEAARASDVYQRALARAHLAELGGKRAA